MRTKLVQARGSARCIINDASPVEEQSRTEDTWTTTLAGVTWSLG